LKFLAAYRTNGLPAGQAGKKIVISRGLIELGPASEPAHKTIGKLISQVADEFIIISPDSVLALEAGSGAANLKIITIFKPAKLLKYLKQNQGQPNLILLEGRMPKIIKQEIKTN